jgi:hypothetical protein
VNETRSTTDGNDVAAGVEAAVGAGVVELVEDDIWIEEEDATTGVEADDETSSETVDAREEELKSAGLSIAELPDKDVARVVARVPDSDGDEAVRVVDVRELEVTAGDDTDSKVVVDDEVCDEGRTDIEDDGFEADIAWQSPNPAWQPFPQ